MTDTPKISAPKLNLRPEVPAENKKHMAYWLSPASYQNVLVGLKAKGALHRAAFVTAAVETNGYFIDVRQNPDEVPYPEDGRRFCAIIGDRETREYADHDGVAITDALWFESKGPAFYHQESLRKLVSQVRMVTIDLSGQGSPAIYAMAVFPLAMQGFNTLLIESTEKHSREWVHFVDENTSNCRHHLILDSDRDGEKMQS